MCFKTPPTSMPPEVIGGRLFGGFRPCFCFVNFTIWHLFQAQFPVSRYRDIKFLVSRYHNCYSATVYQLLTLLDFLVSRYTNYNAFQIFQCHGKTIFWATISTSVHTQKLDFCVFFLPRLISGFKNAKIKLLGMDTRRNYDPKYCYTVTLENSKALIIGIP